MVRVVGHEENLAAGDGWGGPKGALEHSYVGSTAGVRRTCVLVVSHDGPCRFLMRVYLFEESGASRCFLSFFALAANYHGWDAQETRFFFPHERSFS